MKKTLITALIMLSSLICLSQYSDIAFIGSSISIHYLHVQPDKNLHYTVGYWGTKATYKLVKKTLNVSDFLAQTISASLLLSVSVIKELTDNKFERNDIYFTGAGIALAVISINIKF